MFVISSGARCADAPATLPLKLRPVFTCPALARAAETNHIPIDGFDPSTNSKTLRPGDSATILGTLILKRNQAQWLLYIEATEPDPKKPNKPEKPMVVNLFGAPISFESKPVPAHLRMLGPFPMNGPSKQLKPQVRNEQFSLNESFLGLGLEQAAQVIYEKNQSRHSARDSSPTNSPAAGDKRTNASNTNASPKLTPEQKRSISGAVPALMSYFEIVQHTQGLEDLLLKLVKLPSVWSIVRHVGVSADFGFGKEAYPANPTDWNLPASVPVYYLPCLFRLNGQPALKVTLVVTVPRPPLLISGGIIGLLAERPGDDDSYMTLRIISARQGLNANGDK